MTEALDVSRLIRPGDFLRIREIDYMANPRGASSADLASCFELD